MDENDLMYGSLPEDSGFIGPFIQEADILDRPDLFYGSQGMTGRRVIDLFRLSNILSLVSHSPNLSASFFSFLLSLSRPRGPDGRR